MKKKYYNKFESGKAKAQIFINPYESKRMFEEYLKKYPEDYFAYPFYVIALVFIGDFNKATDIFNYSYNMFKNDLKFNSEPTRSRFVNNSFIFNKLQLLSYQEKYEELYYYCLKNSNDIKATGINPQRLIINCQKMLGLLDYSIRPTQSYLYKQIIEFREEDLLEHLQKHLANYNNGINTPNTSIFSPNIDITQLLTEVRKYLLNDKTLYPGIMEDLYIFKYDNCGHDNYKSVDYFKVICIHNTMNIITMCPANNCKYLPHNDLNYLNHNNDFKIKKRSQIDRFNQRYKLK